MLDYRAYFVGSEKQFVGYKASLAETMVKLSTRPRSFSKVPRLSFGAARVSSHGSAIRRSRAASASGQPIGAQRTVGPALSPRRPG